MKLLISQMKTYDLENLDFKVFRVLDDHLYQNFTLELVNKKRTVTVTYTFTLSDKDNDKNNPI